MGRSQQIRGGGRSGPPDADALAADDAGCSILHVDMDAFYCSVEVRARPELAGQPVVVAGLGPRGVVSSASYKAREFGVRSAMPTARARRLCPHAVFLPPDFPAYSAASAAVMEIFRGVTPLVEPLSLDEAFLDVAGATRLLGRPAEIGAGIRARILAELGLTCSVGVAATKFMAKLASTRAKPDGMLVVPAARALEFLHPLPVEALWGVGDRTAETLRRLGLTTVGQVAEAPLGMLRHALGEAAAGHLHELAWARDPRPVDPRRVEKSIGAETTFDKDVADPEVLRRALLALATKVAVRLRGSGQAGRTVALKVRLADFTTVARSRTLRTPTDVGREIFDTAWELFTALRAGGTGPVGLVRLVGVRVEGLVAAADAPRQPALGERDRGWREAEQAADAAVTRFGAGAIRPASLLRNHGRERILDPLSDPLPPS